MMRCNKNRILNLWIVVLAGFMLILPSALALVPYGATLDVTNVSTAFADTPGNASAFAGNVSELVLSGFSTTQAWQGYYGNVSGTIQLADSEDKVMYNWSLANPRGEVYATTNNSIVWLKIQCFNYTANGTYETETITPTVGGTNQFGTNLTQLEDRFGINTSDVDGVDETFTLQGLGTHNPFYTANRQFNEGECMSTEVYGISQSSQSDIFEEAILYEPETTSVIFTSILENNVQSFNNRTSDFEMLVPENGHGTNVDATTYYFFVEIQ
jgi:hypothetical protein